MNEGVEDGGRRILCIRLSGLGDVVHALNALSLLREELPDAFIAWAVEERFADLLRGHPHVDELVTVPRKEWGRMAKNPLRWPALRRAGKAMAARVRGMSFDASVDFQSSLKSAWLVRVARAPLRIGFGGEVNRELNRLVQNRLVDVAAGGVHRCERDLALLGPLGIPARQARPALPANEEARRAVDDLLAGRLADGPVVVIHPGTSAFAAFKRWPAERYAAVAGRLAAERGADVVVTCGPDDRDLAERVLAGMRRPGTLVPPVAGLAGLIEVLRRADLFLGSDTGPMHLASALGVPVVALFGPKDPVQTGPYCSRSIVVTADVDCRPCTRRRCRNALCMQYIAVEHVLEAALKLLDGGGTCRADGADVEELTARMPGPGWKGDA